MNTGERVYAGFGRNRPPLVPRVKQTPSLPSSDAEPDTNPELAQIQAPPRLRTPKSKSISKIPPKEDDQIGAHISPQTVAAPVVESSPTQADTNPFEQDKFLLDTGEIAQETLPAVDTSQVLQVQIPQDDPEISSVDLVDPASPDSQENNLSMDTESSSPEALLPVEIQRFPRARWSIHAQIRLLSHHPDALTSAHSFTPEPLTQNAEGLFVVHPDVVSSLQTHFTDMQKREWDAVRVPKKKSMTPHEKKQALKWADSKKEFAQTIGISFASGETDGTQIVTEAFAYKLHLWMQACTKSIAKLSRESSQKEEDVAQALSYLGISEEALAESKAGDTSALYKNLWTMYQTFFSKGTNSPHEFSQHIAKEIKKKYPGADAIGVVQQAMNIYRKLPFFGKDHVLMDAIEMTTTAMIQDQSSYTQVHEVSWLDPASHDSKVLSFIQERIPASSRRKVALPQMTHPITPRRDIHVPLALSDDDLPLVSQM